MDVTMVEIPTYYGMLLSRQWSNLVRGNIQLDLSYETIHVNGRYVKIYRELRFTYLVEISNPDYGINFCQTDIDNFKVNLSKLVQC